MAIKKVQRVERKVFKNKVTKKKVDKYVFRALYKDFNNETKDYTSKAYDTITEAEDAERLFLLNKSNKGTKAFKIVAASYFEEMYKKRKESTVYCYENNYNNNIKPFFEKTNIDKITIQDIRNWHEYMDNKKQLNGKPLSVSFKNKNNTILCSIFDHAIRNFGLDSNPAKIVGLFESTNEEIKKDEEKLHYITYEQFKKLISVIDDNVWYAFFNFLYYTGMRKGEIQALSWKDIDFSTNIINVNKTLSTKTKQAFKLTSTKNNTNRKIKMNKTLTEIMLNYKEQMKEYKDFKEDWFIFGNTRFLPHQNIDRAKSKYFKLAELEEIRIHDFRHSCVSLLINEYIKASNEKNVKIDTSKFFLMMSSRMGHTVEVMQRTYMHLFPTAQDEIVDLLDNL